MITKDCCKKNEEKTRFVRTLTFLFSIFLKICSPAAQDQVESSVNKMCYITLHPSFVIDLKFISIFLAAEKKEKTLKGSSDKKGGISTSGFWKRWLL